MSLFALARRLQMLPRRDYTWQWQDSDFRSQPAGSVGISRAGVLRPSGIVDQGETGEVRRRQDAPRARPHSPPRACSR
jgi:hypothetical protein